MGSLGSFRCTDSTREAIPQLLAVCVKNILLLAYGTTLGFPTILIPSLSGNDKDEIIVANDDTLSWIGSLNLICVPLGCIFSGIISQPYGRRRAMQLLNIPFVTAWLIFHFSTQIWHLFAALCIIGVTGGLLEAPVLTYVAEITQPHLRGMLSSSSTMFVILGMLVSFLLGTFLHWRTVTLVNCTFPILAFILLMFVPESPHWLIQKNRYNQAKSAIAWLRGWKNVNDAKVLEEFHYLCKALNEKSVKKSFEVESNSSSETLPIIRKKSKLKLFGEKNFLWPFALVTFTFTLGHFSGNTTLQVYAIRIFVTLNVSFNKYYATILVGAVQLLGVALCVFCINFVGKRLMVFTSLLGLGSCFIVVATYAYVKNIYFLKPASNDSTEDPDSWIPLIFLVLSAFFAYICIKGLPWILIGEVYSSETKSTAAGLSGGLSYIIGFISNKTFLSMVSTFTLPGVFWFYGGVAYLGCLIMYFVLPETEGRTLFEISEHFAGRDRLGNKVRKKNGNDKSNESSADENFETKF